MLTFSPLQIANNYMQQVHIFKQFHKNIIGKGGANIKKIRDETDTRIDLPSESSDSDVISITGKKENVEKARDKIETIQKELVRPTKFVIKYDRISTRNNYRLLIYLS